MVFSFNHLFIVSPSSWLLELVLWTKPSFSFKKRFGNVIFGTSGTSPYLKEGLSVRDWGTRLSYAIKLRVLSSVACHGLLEMRLGSEKYTFVLESIHQTFKRGNVLNLMLQMVHLGVVRRPASRLQRMLTSMQNCRRSREPRTTIVVGDPCRRKPTRSRKPK